MVISYVDAIFVIIRFTVVKVNTFIVDTLFIETIISLVYKMFCQTAKMYT